MKRASIKKIQQDRENFADRFPYYVGCLCTEGQIKTTFLWDDEELDKASNKAFGMPWLEAYRYYRNLVLMEGQETIMEIAKCGNGAALKIMAEALMGLKAEEQKEASKVVVSFDIK